VCKFAAVVLDVARHRRPWDACWHQTVKDKISIMRSSKLVQKPISEYFSKV
jgi:hypothetical protein